jgi:hypothetical protein
VNFAMVTRNPLNVCCIKFVCFFMYIISIGSIFCGVFNDAVCGSDCVASNGRMISE